MTRLTPTDRAALAYASRAVWQPAWEILPATQFRAREDRCRRLEGLGYLKSSLIHGVIVYRRTDKELP